MAHPQVLRDMALFVEVAKRKSFSQAALALEMPVSSLSRRITLFEAALGVRLLDRTTRRISLTTYGEAYFTQALRLVEEAQRAYDDIATEAKGPSGLLRIAAPSGPWMTQHLSTILAEFRTINAHVQVQADLSHAPADLIGDRYDLALAVEEPREGSLVMRKIVEMERGMFASPSYLEEWGLPHVPQDLSDHRAIVSGQSATWALTRGDETASVTVSGPIASNSATLSRRLAVEGHGIFLANVAQVKPDVSGGALIRIMSDWQLPPTPVYIVTTSRLLPAKVRAFIDFASKRLPAMLCPTDEERREAAAPRRCPSLPGAAAGGPF